MTTPADDAAGEQAFENAFEAYLTGRPVPAEAADLAAFAGAVRMSATEPGRPNAALAELLATGLLVDQPPLSVRTAKRRRRPMWFFSAILAKIVSAGAVAQAATGAGIVLVGFTGIGAAGALPAPVQHTFATVVAAVTPLTAPGGTSTDGTTTDPVTTTDPAAPTTDPAAPTTGTADPTGSTDGAAGAPAEATTSAPKNFGQQVSSAAHERNAARKAEHDAEHSKGSDETGAPVATSTEGDASDSSDGESSGSGSTSGDQGSGQSGSGHSGHGDN